LSRRTDPEQARPSICAAAQEVSRASRTILYEPDPESDALVSTAAVGEEPGRLVPFKGVSGALTAYRAERPLFVPDVPDNPLVSQARAAETGAQSCLWQPVLADGRCVGVLVAVWTERVERLPRR